MGGDQALIVAGIGFRSTCRAVDLVALVCRAERAFGVRADLIAAPAFKAYAPAVQDAAQMLGLDLLPVGLEALEAVQALCLTRSARAAAAVGLGSVAEACALAGAGEAGRLLGARLASSRATCAMATEARP